MKILIPLSVILLTAFTSCRQTKDVTCDTGWFGFVGAGLSVADFDGATIRQYQAGSNFSKLVQSGSITYYLWERGSVTSDSGNVAPPAAMAVAHEPEAIPTTYDYIISIPAAGINDTLSDGEFLGPIHEVLTYSDAHPAHCINQMASYKLNGQIITNASGQTDHMIYLVK